jgi:hypothetical protein
MEESVILSPKSAPQLLQLLAFLSHTLAFAAVSPRCDAASLGGMVEGLVTPAVKHKNATVRCVCMCTSAHISPAVSGRNESRAWRGGGRVERRWKAERVKGCVPGGVEGG